MNSLPISNLFGNQGGTNVKTPNVLSMADISTATANLKKFRDYQIYNTDTPQLSDINLQKVSDISRVRMRDRFFIDMKLRNNANNGDGYTLGRNDKGLKNFGLESYIDPNRRMKLNPNNTHMTTPDSFFTGNDKNYYYLEPDAVVERDQRGLIIQSRLDYSYKGKKLQLEGK